MNGEAKELRALAKAIRRLTAESRISSIAMPMVSLICDYLTLQAKAMELVGALELERRR